MITERALHANIVRIHITFQNDFGVSRDLQIDRVAFYELQSFLSHNTGKEEFIHSFWNRGDRRKNSCRIGAYNDGNFDWFSLFFCYFVMQCTPLVSLPVNQGFLIANYLNSINTY